MRAKDLPPSKPVALGKTVAVLDAALSEILGPGQFPLLMIPVEGLVNDVYLIERENRKSTSSFVGIQVAIQLEKISKGNGRYVPKPYEPSEKGWMLRSAEIDGKKVAIAYASWLT